LLTELESEQQAELLAAKLASLNGVVEATVVLEENRTYLKVNDKEFDLQQAKAAVSVA
jgi:hypothetical protein